jgi:hypothetical protein
MTTAFKVVMAKMQVLGQDTSKLVDCSDVVPKSKAFSGPIKYPASFSQADVQIAVSGFLRIPNYYVLNSTLVHTTALPQPFNRCGSCTNCCSCVSSIVAFCTAIAERRSLVLGLKLGNSQGGYSIYFRSDLSVYTYVICSFTTPSSILRFRDAYISQ